MPQTSLDLEPPTCSKPPRTQFPHCILISTVALLNWGSTVSALAHPGASGRLARGLDGVNSRQIHNNDYAGGQPNSGTDAPGDSAPPGGDVSRKRQAPAIGNPAAAVTSPINTATASSSGSSSITTTTETTTTTQSATPSASNPLDNVKGVANNVKPSQSSESSSTTVTSSSSAAASTTPGGNPAQQVAKAAEEKLAGKASSSEPTSASGTATSSDSASATPPANALKLAEALEDKLGWKSTTETETESASASGTATSSGESTSPTPPAQGAGVGVEGVVGGASGR